MTPRALTDVEEAEVVARYQAGQSTLKLAARFGVHYSTIMGALERAGVDRRPTQVPKDADTATIRRLRDIEHLSWDRIAAEVGMSPSGVRKRYLGRTRQNGVSHQVTTP